MRATLKKSKAILGLREDLQSLRRRYLSKRKQFVQAYLQNAVTPSLHIGAYTSHIPGWLETDIEPADSETIYLDATKTFPIPSAALSYIYTEHMIEHVPFAAGLSMLKECRRVLRPGGALRVATPDLAFILKLYSNPGDDGRSYMDWIRASFMATQSEAATTTASIINFSFHSWGHKFLYDGDTLTAALHEAGFHKIARVKYGESEHEHLRGIERHGLAMGNVEMARLETMIFEAS